MDETFHLTPLDVRRYEFGRALRGYDPERVEQGLARLVLTVIEVVRKVLEHQAVRRMDGGDLSVEEVERLGLTLLKLNDRMHQLKESFGLTDEDLEIDLGPLGRLR